MNKFWCRIFEKFYRKIQNAEFRISYFRVILMPFEANVRRIFFASFLFSRDVLQILIINGQVVVRGLPLLSCLILTLNAFWRRSSN